MKNRVTEQELQEIETRCRNVTPVPYTADIGTYYMNLPHHQSRLVAELRLLKDLGIISINQLKQLTLDVLKEGKK